MAERSQSAATKPYFKDQFRYDAQKDSYICPRGHSLHFRGFRRDRRNNLCRYHVYSASRTICHNCPAYGTCTKDAHSGRALWIGNSDLLLRRHRQWMKTDEARCLYARRQQIIEPTFGILKEQMGARRFLLRGLLNVRAEFTLMATAFNLRVLSRIRNRLSTSQLTSELNHLTALKDTLKIFNINVYFNYALSAS